MRQALSVTLAYEYAWRFFTWFSASGKVRFKIASGEHAGMVSLQALQRNATTRAFPIVKTISSGRRINFLPGMGLLREV